MADGWFEIEPCPLAGLKRVRRDRRGDERGFFGRLYDRGEFAAAGFDRPVVQINQSFTARSGSVRGMHFQLPPSAEDKLVTVLRGSVFDVAVDLRAGSPTLLQWHGETLSADNATALFIPRGFAHGFQTLTDDCELLYLHSAAFDRACERGLDPFDPLLAIEWRLPVADMSARDRAHPPLTTDFPGIAL